MEIRSIFVVGAGTMGNGIAQVAATSGYQVTMMDVVPGQVERAQAIIAKSAEKLLSKIATEARAGHYLSDVLTANDIEFFILVKQKTFGEDALNKSNNSRAEIAKTLATEND